VTSPAPAVLTSRAQTRNLALATWAFAISFWAWNLIAPLGVRYTDELGLSSAQKSLLVALPILVGSVGRIPAGMLTDRYGGRLMFAVPVRVDPPGPARQPRRQPRLVRPAAAVRVLPRHRRHHVRCGHPVCECVVRAEPQGPPTTRRTTTTRWGSACCASPRSSRSSSWPCSSSENHQPYGMARLSGVDASGRSDRTRPLPGS
jgi:hypothetical protein